MNNDQKKKREHQKQIMKLIERLTNASKQHCYSLAGKWRKEFGVDICVAVLSRLNPGTPIPYCVSALQREKQKTINHKDINNITEGWIDDEDPAA